MSLSTVFSRALIGVDAVEVSVETHLSNGLPGFAIVGLPETAVRESKERVRSAILNTGLDFPARRITVNLAPADIPKSGGKYDLAIALCILVASKQLSAEILDNVEILGELALDGKIRGVHGALSAIIAASKVSRRIILPHENITELTLANYAYGYSFSSLLDIVDALQKEPQNFLCAGSQKTQRLVQNKNRQEAIKGSFRIDEEVADEIKGQVFAKLAIKIAAAGGHNILMLGPPGCGKTLLANRMLQLLPGLTDGQAMDVASIRSAAGLTVQSQNDLDRPVRMPHHSATAVSLLGGGQKAMPGEISLAHHGVLFLDEIAEFKRGVLDSLREPLESGEINISRANYRLKFPANFQLVAAMNPCPCGYAGDNSRDCRCGRSAVDRYLAKLSGPLLDRFDLIVDLAGLSHGELLLDESTNRNPYKDQQEVINCRSIQLKRLEKLNSELSVSDIEKLALLQTKQKETLAGLLESTGMSSRATHRIIKVARTVADLEFSSSIQDTHLQQAVMLRKSALVSQSSH